MEDQLTEGSIVVNIIVLASGISNTSVQDTRESQTLLNSTISVYTELCLLLTQFLEEITCEPRT